MVLVNKNKNRGFSVVELLIILVIVGILALLVFTFYSGIQERNRDNVRESDIEKIQGAVEAYNDKNGNFPTLAELNNATFRSSNLTTLTASVLKDPKGTSDTLVDTPTAHVYAYAPTPFGCDDTATDCTGYTLTATLESGRTFVKQNVN